MKDVQRVEPTEAHAEAVEPGGMGARDAMRRSLAGMTYAQQLEAVRPPMPVQGGPVQFQEEGGESESAPREDGPNREAPELASPASGVPRHITEVIGEDRWLEINRAWVRGATDQETIVAVIQALIDPTLYHAGPEGPGAQRESAEGETQTASDCHYTTWLIVEALKPFGIAVDWQQRVSGHSTPWFPTIGLGLWDGDDLYFHPRQVAQVASAEDLLLTQEEILAWDEMLANEPYRIQDEIESALEGAENPEMARIVEYVSDHNVVLAAPSSPDGGAALVEWHKLPGLEVLEHVRPGVLSALPARDWLDELTNSESLLQQSLQRLPRMLQARGDFPDLEPALERLLPGGFLPTDRDGALRLAGRAIEQRVLRNASRDAFFSRHIRPPYRDGASE